MTERRPIRRPGAGAVVWGSIALFAVLFALLTYQLGVTPSTNGSTASTSQPVQVRKVIKRRVVTTIVPTPGVNQVLSGPATSSSYGGAAEPVTTSAS
jgi:hypothetical protein